MDVHGLLCPKAFFEDNFFKVENGFNYNVEKKSSLRMIIGC
jgi:hypothetical protein